MPALQELCKEEMEASKGCMQRYNYDRERYWVPCRKAFQDFRDCKARWQQMRKSVMSNGGTVAAEASSGNADASTLGARCTQ
ncbi:hypothetical protein SeMB42_g04118 [Synchytrium endobioticum]|nr:hypothetical protein SeMB42_g04118 [Synchytrium endobioticum]